MSVKASYNGFNFEFPDGTSDEAIYDHIRKTVGENREPILDEGNEAGFFSGGSPDGSIIDTAGARMGLQHQALLSAGAQNPTLAAYQNKRTQEALKGWKDQSSKLSGAENLAAGMLGAAPAIAAGMANPVIGGAVAAGMGTLDTLAQQAEEGKGYSLGKAGLSGLATGVTDALTGGLANKAKMALPAAGMLNMGGRLATNVAEDLTSNVASQVYTNLGSGREWSQDIGDAAAGGVVGGMALRGSLHGINKAVGMNWNKGGETAQKDLKNLSDKGFTPTEDFRGQVTESNNIYQGNFNSLLDSDIADPNAVTAIDGMINSRIEGGGQAADLEAIKMFDKYKIPMTDAGFDVEMGMGYARNSDKYNAGESLGLTKEEMIKSAELAEYVTDSRFGNVGAKARGETAATDQAAFKTAWDNAMGDMAGTFKNNISIADDLNRRFGANGVSPDSVLNAKAVDLATDLKTLDRIRKDYVGSGKTAAVDELRSVTRRVYENAQQLGVLDKLQNVDGSTGGFDPVKNLMTIDRFDKMGQARMSNIHRAAPNKAKNKVEGSARNPVSGFLAAATRPMDYIGRKLPGEFYADARAMMKRKKFAKSKEKTAARVSALASSDLAKMPVRKKIKADAEAAQQDLRNMGIQTDLASKPEPEAPVQAPEPTSTPEPSNPTPEPAKAPTEAPVETPEPTVTKAKPGSLVKKKKKAAPAEKAKPGSRSKGMELPQAKREKPQEAPQKAPEAVEESKVEPSTDKAPEAATEAPKKREPGKLVNRTKKKEAAPEPTPEPVAKPAPGERSKGMTQPMAKKTVEAEAPVKEEAPKKVESFSDDELESIFGGGFKATKELVETQAAKSEPLPASKAPKSKKVEEPAPEPVAKKDDFREVAATKAPKPKAEEPQVEVTKEDIQSVKDGEEPSEAAQEVLDAYDAKTEAPVVETTPKGKVSALDLVKAPMEKELKSLPKTLSGGFTTETALARSRAEAEVKESNRLLHKLSDEQKVDPEVIAQHILDNGGIRNIMTKARELGLTTEAYLKGRISEFNSLVKTEASDLAESVRAAAKEARAKDAESKKDTAEKGKDDAQAKKDKEAADKITAKHEQIRSELEELGFSDEIVSRALKAGRATDESVDFNPADVRRVAKELDKKEVEKARAAKEAMDKKLATIKKRLDDLKPTPSIQDSKAQIRKFLSGLDVNNDADVQKMVRNAVVGRDKPLTEGQLNTLYSKILNHFDKESARYDDYLRTAKSPDATDEAFARAQMDSMRRNAELARQNQKTLEEARKKILERQKVVEQEASQAAREHAKTVREYESLFKQADKRDELLKRNAEKAKADADAKEASTKALEEQQAKFMEDLIQAKVPEDIAREATYKAFINRNEPLKDVEVSKARSAAIASVESEIKAANQRLAKAIQKELDNAKPEHVAAASRDIIMDASQDSPDAVSVVVKAITDKLETTNSQEAAAVKTMGSIMENALRMQKEYPNDKSLWISSDDKLRLQKAFNKGKISPYIANLGMEIKSRIFGDTVKGDSYMRYSDKEIAERREASKLGEGLRVRVRKKKTRSKQLGG